jgi:3-hydroxybutyryl-CoA dehydrogenase
MLEEGSQTPGRSTPRWNSDTATPWGPLRSTDLVGLDVRLAIAEYLHRTLGERFAPPQLLRDKVARRELGRKTGRGFHVYKEGPAA